MLAFFAIAGLAFAQAPPPPPYIQAFGEGVVAVAPDQAHIAVGVVTQAATAEAAGTQNAERADAVIRELRRVAGPNAEIRTAGYSLEPMYRSPRDAAPEISGYTARNTVLVTTSDLKSVGPIIDAAMKAGAN
ncbi:MAG TPA: SIMPL domain-containing protein, partial [Bryobacteraceae bacterium]|nr:SIMPL domain-containing protein [Bryobacteraceae bacterium]